MNYLFSAICLLTVFSNTNLFSDKMKVSDSLQMNHRNDIVALSDSSTNKKTQPPSIKCESYPEKGCDRHQGKSSL